jgi:ORF6N domain
MSKEIVPAEQIALRIRHFRGEKVLLDFDLAKLYGVATRALNQAVKRNRERFPDDFMFQLTTEEALVLRSQTVTSSLKGTGNQEIMKNRSQTVTGSKQHGGPRYRPYAFTEQGIAMLSSVLNSKRAVKVNIAIMRAFVKLRWALETNRELARKFSELERRVDKHDEEIAAILEAIRQLMAPPEKPRREIGFHVREKAPRYRATKRA